MCIHKRLWNYANVERRSVAVPTTTVRVTSVDTQHVGTVTRTRVRPHPIVLDFVAPDL